MFSETITFEIPTSVAQGVAGGRLERVGGIIREVDTKRVVFWLREGVRDFAGSTSLAVKVSKLARATLAFSDFLYMNQRFNELRSLLGEVIERLDAQNFSKLHAGFNLAAEAEVLRDPQLAQSQLLHARQLLEEGSEIFRQLFTARASRRQTADSWNACRLALLGKIAVARTYLSNGEYEPAEKRIVALRHLCVDSALHYLREHLDPKMSWYEVLTVIVFSPILLPIGMLVGDTEELLIAKAADRLRAETAERWEELTELVRRAEGTDRGSSPEVTELMILAETLQGYEVEVQALAARRLRLDTPSLRLLESPS